jgi:dihydroorotase-like cyclic amidohydrolase
MRVFVGEPGFEYKENFKSLSQAALSGGVTSVVTMPNTAPIIDNVRHAFKDVTYFNVMKDKGQVDREQTDSL